MKKLVLAMAFSLAALAGRPESQIDNGRLIVDGKEFFICGGELGNSGASCKEDVDASYARYILQGKSCQAHAESGGNGH